MTGAGLGASNIAGGLLAPSSGDDGGDVDCPSQEGLCHWSPCDHFPPAGGDEPGARLSLCHHLVSQGQPHCELLLGGLLRFCPSSSKTADGGGHCHHGWWPSCRHCQDIPGDSPVLAGFSRTFL